MINAIGLFILIAFLGYGLVEVPRQLWNKGNTEGQLRYMKFKVRESVSELHAQPNAAPHFTTDSHPPTPTHTWPLAHPQVSSFARPPARPRPDPTRLAQPTHLTFHLPSSTSTGCIAIRSAAERATASRRDPGAGSTNRGDAPLGQRRVGVAAGSCHLRPIPPHPVPNVHQPSVSSVPPALSLPVLPDPTIPRPTPTTYHPSNRIASHPVPPRPIPSCSIPHPFPSVVDRSHHSTSVPFPSRRKVFLCSANYHHDTNASIVEIYPSKTIHPITFNPVYPFRLITGVYEKAPCALPPIVGACSSDVQRGCGFVSFM